MAFRMSLSSRKLLVGTALLGGAALAGFTGRPPQAHANGWDDDHDHDRDRNRDRDHEPDRYTIALWGDMPYNALGKQQYPNLLASVNASDIAFSIFDGDLKAGGDGPCTDENVYTPAVKYFASLKQPMIWLPGDNDWTDCWGRYGAGTSLPGADDPIERLNHERALFTSTPYSLGQRKLRLTRQSSRGRRVRALLRERSLEAGTGRLHRAQRAGLERQLPVRGRRRRDAVTDGDRPAARGGGRPQGRRHRLAERGLCLREAGARGRRDGRRSRRTSISTTSSTLPTRGRTTRSPTTSPRSRRPRWLSRGRWCWSMATRTTSSSTSR